jgi:transcriptional regulator GlxA family with amidase domain
MTAKGGRRERTHWAYADPLPLVGATHERARIMKDGNVITAGGVTSLIDFGLSVRLGPNTDFQIDVALHMCCGSMLHLEGIAPCTIN